MTICHTVIIVLHLLTAAVTAVLFTLRGYWRYRDAHRLKRGWVRVVPHINDTLLLLTGVLLVVITPVYPFTPQGSWLTFKMAGVVLYIALGKVALSRRQDARRLRQIAFVMALLTLVTIVTLAITRVPIPEIYDFD